MIYSLQATKICRESGGSNFWKDESYCLYRSYSSTPLNGIVAAPHPVATPTFQLPIAVPVLSAMYSRDPTFITDLFIRLAHNNQRAAALVLAALVHGDDRAVEIATSLLKALDGDDDDAARGLLVLMLETTLAT